MTFGINILNVLYDVWYKYFDMTFYMTFGINILNVSYDVWYKYFEGFI